MVRTRSNSQRSTDGNDYVAINHNPFIMNNNEPSVNGMTSTPEFSSSHTNMPPLRIAPFAKEHLRKKYRSMPEMPQNQIRISNVQSGNIMQLQQQQQAQQQQQQKRNINKSHTLKGPQSSSSVNILHIPPETPPLTRFSKSTLNGGQLRLKHTPLRKTPVSMMPELHPICPKVPESDFQAYKYTTPALNKKAQKRALRDAKMAEQNAKKRRLQAYQNSDSSNNNNWNISSSSTRAAEAQRSKRISNYDNYLDGHAYYNENNNNNNDDDDENDDDYVDDDALLFSVPPLLPSVENVRNNNNNNNNNNNGNRNNLISHLEMNFFRDMLTEFQNSLRDMQREMMSNFVSSQMEFARREHEFQIKHDKLKLESFKKQSEDFWKSARGHIGGLNNNKWSKTTEKIDKSCQTEDQSVEIKENTENKNVDHSTTIKIVQKTKNVAVQTENVLFQEPRLLNQREENGYNNNNDNDDNKKKNDYNDYDDDVAVINNELNNKKAELTSNAIDVYKSCEMKQRALFAEQNC